MARLADLNLHDAEILSRSEQIQPGGPLPFPDIPFPVPIVTWSAVAIVSVRQGGDVLSLLYSLWDRVREYPASEDWPFSKAREHWLYDEVDVGPGRWGAFVHRILVSSGVELEIPFVTVVLHRFAIHLDAVSGAQKETD